MAPIVDPSFGHDSHVVVFTEYVFSGQEIHRLTESSETNPTGQVAEILNIK